MPLARCQGVEEEEEEEDGATTKTGRQDDERRRAEISQLKCLALQSSAELSLRQESSDWGHVSKLLHMFRDRKGQAARTTYQKKNVPNLRGYF